MTMRDPSQTVIDIRDTHTSRLPVIDEATMPVPTAQSTKTEHVTSVGFITLAVIAAGVYVVLPLAIVAHYISSNLLLDLGVAVALTALGWDVISRILVNTSTATERVVDVRESEEEYEFVA
jgi:hypothetical protein